MLSLPNEIIENLLMRVVTLRVCFDRDAAHVDTADASKRQRRQR